ncbi:MAG: hypothetical protein LBK65_00095 [Tannerellaceae bacterium]|nr:hypothetical protein [Tannerellaceae bacterium]
MDNPVTYIVSRKSERAVPGDLADRPTDNRSRPHTLRYRRRTAEVSKADRQLCNTLLKSDSGL